MRRLRPLGGRLYVKRVVTRGRRMWKRRRDHIGALTRDRTLLLCSFLLSSGKDGVHAFHFYFRM